MTKATQCSICNHPRRPEIDHSLANRVSEWRVAKRFSVSRDAIHRHKKKHLPPQLEAALLSQSGAASSIDLEALRKSESEGLLQTLIWQKAHVLQQIDKAEANMDPVAVSVFHKVLLENTKTIAKLVGDLASRSGHVTNNFLIAPQYLELRHAITRALEPFPDARKAVAMTLQAMERTAPPAIEHVAAE
ncbi:MAG: hypothetical protein K2P94_00825 [Rhodospirillaceae bacterium]|nr:hypothetical protein [Rhodospirillaceae bacterium]